MSPACAYGNQTYAAFRVETFKSLFGAPPAHFHHTRRLLLTAPFARRTEDVPPRQRDFSSSPGQLKASYDESGELSRASLKTRLASPETSTDSTKVVNDNNGTSPNLQDLAPTSLSGQPEESLRYIDSIKSKKRWTARSSRGQRDLKSLLSSLQAAAREASIIEEKVEEVGIPFSGARRLSDTLPESPVLRRMRMAKLHKRQATDEEMERLANNPWAKILSSPVRFCQATGVRLPRDLMLPWSLTKNSQDKKTYLVPAELAEMDLLRNGVSDPNDTQAIENAKTADHRAGKKTSRPGENADMTARASRPKINTVALKPLLRHLTLSLTAPESADVGHPKRNTNRSAVARLLSQRVKIAFKTAEHYARQRQLEAGVGRLENPDPENAIDLPNLQWETDIEERVLKIMRERVLASLEGLGIQLGSRRARRRKLVQSFATVDAVILETGKMETAAAETRIESRTCFEGLARPTQREEDQGAINPFQEHPEETEIERESLARRLGGSILVQVGTASHSQALAHPNSSLDTPRSLLYTSLLPPTVAVTSTLALPFFNLHNLLGAKGLAHFHQLAQKYDVLGPDPANKPLDPRRKLEAEGNEDSDSDYILLMQARGRGASQVIEEIWQLWRYMGGSLEFAHGEEAMAADQWDLRNWMRNSKNKGE